MAMTAWAGEFTNLRSPCPGRLGSLPILGTRRDPPSLCHNGAADSALAVADLLDCFNQSRSIFIVAPKLGITFDGVDACRQAGLWLLSVAHALSAEKTEEQLPWAGTVATPSSIRTDAGTRDASNNYSSIPCAVCAKLTTG